MATHLYLLAVQVIFAVSPVVSIVAFREISPWSLAWVRLALAAFILLVWFFVASPDRVELSDYGRLAIFSVFGASVNQLCYLHGLSLTTAINATILIGMIPVFTFVIALLLGREATSVGKTLGVVLAFAGVFVLAGPGSISFDSTYSVGNVLLLSAAFAYSVYLVLARNIMSRYHPLTVVTWVFTFGSVVMLPFAWGDVARTSFLSLSALTWASIAFLVVFTSILAYFLTGFVLKKASSTLVAVYICLQPVMVAFLAVPILGETLTWTMALSGVLIFSGVVLSAADRPPTLVEG